MGEESYQKDKYIQILEKKVEDYEKKELAIREALKKGKEVLGITGRESGTEIVAKLMAKLPMLLTGGKGQFQFLNELFFVFKDEIKEEEIKS